ncbi:MAG: ATP-binding protein [Nitrososphaerota archaeon]|nr:ATP-binding protein [Nitrososphaerota archaeon]
MSRRGDIEAAMADWDPGSISRLPMVGRRADMPPREPRSVVTITGPRRAGKTYFMYLVARKLIEEGVPPERILYVNFEHERLDTLRERDLETMLAVYYELAPPALSSDRPYLFLDEVQNVRGWGKWVRRVHDGKEARVYVSGSSSKLLSRELSTELRGRSTDYVVFPFSFAEFLDAKGIEAPDIRRLPHLEERGKVLALLKEYLETGGYPEVVLEPSQGVKEKVLRSYFDTILYRDLVERFDVRSPALLDSFVKLCLASHAKYLSASKSYNHLRGLGFRTRKQTVLDYLRYVSESYVIIPLEIYSRSVKNRAQYPKKVYAVDTGLVRVGRFETGMGRLMENCALVELARRSSYFSDFQVYYWKEYGKAEGAEVDFVVVQGGKAAELVQVTYATAADGLDAREVDSLRKASAELGCKKLVVLTWDYRDRRGGVEFVPLWEWLLQARST